MSDEDTIILQNGELSVSLSIICGVCGLSAKSLTLACPGDYDCVEFRICLLDEVLNLNEFFFMCDECLSLVLRCTTTLGLVHYSRSLSEFQAVRGCFLCGSNKLLNNFRLRHDVASLMVLQRVNRQYTFRTKLVEKICPSCEELYTDLAILYNVIRTNPKYPGDEAATKTKDPLPSEKKYDDCTKEMLAKLRFSPMNRSRSKNLFPFNSHRVYDFSGAQPREKQTNNSNSVASSTNTSNRNNNQSLDSIKNFSGDIRLLKIKNDETVINFNRKSNKNIPDQFELKTERVYNRNSIDKYISTLKPALHNTNKNDVMQLRPHFVPHTTTKQLGNIIDKPPVPLNAVEKQQNLKKILELIRRNSESGHNESTPNPSTINTNGGKKCKLNFYDEWERSHLSFQTIEESGPKDRMSNFDEKQKSAKGGFEQSRSISAITFSENQKCSSENNLPLELSASTEPKIVPELQQFTLKPNRSVFLTDIPHQLERLIPSNEELHFKSRTKEFSHKKLVPNLHSTSSSSLEKERNAKQVKAKLQPQLRCIARMFSEKISSFDNITDRENVTKELLGNFLQQLNPNIPFASNKHEIDPTLKLKVEHLMGQLRPQFRTIASEVSQYNAESSRDGYKKEMTNDHYLLQVNGDQNEHESNGSISNCDKFLSGMEKSEIQKLRYLKSSTLQPDQARRNRNNLLRVLEKFQSKTNMHSSVQYSLKPVVQLVKANITPLTSAVETAKEEGIERIEEESVKNGLEEEEENEEGEYLVKENEDKNEEEEEEMSKVEDKENYKRSLKPEPLKLQLDEAEQTRNDILQLLKKIRVLSVSSELDLNLSCQESKMSTVSCSSLIRAIDIKENTLETRSMDEIAQKSENLRNTQSEITDCPFTYRISYNKNGIKDAWPKSAPRKQNTLNSYDLLKRIQPQCYTDGKPNSLKKVLEMHRKAKFQLAKNNLGQSKTTSTSFMSNKNEIGDLDKLRTVQFDKEYVNSRSCANTCNRDHYNSHKSNTNIRTNTTRHYQIIQQKRQNSNASPKSSVVTKNNLDLRIRERFNGARNLNDKLPNKLRLQVTKTLNKNHYSPNPQYFSTRQKATKESSIALFSKTFCNSTVHTNTHKNKCNKPIPGKQKKGPNIMHGTYDSNEESVSKSADQLDSRSLDSSNLSHKGLSESDTTLYRE